jgi:hypothetical protein
MGCACVTNGYRTDCISASGPIATATQKDGTPMNGTHTDQKYIPPSGLSLPPIKPVDRATVKRIKKEDIKR